MSNVTALRKPANVLFANLAEAEEAIAASVAAYQIAAQAIIEIREKDLWIEGKYESFEQYVGQRWGFSKARAAQLESAGQFVRYVNTNCDDVELPENERICRVLMRIRRRKDRNAPFDFLETEEQVMERRVLAWRQVRDMARNEGVSVTAEFAASVVDFTQRGAKRERKPQTELHDLELAFRHIVECGITPEKAVAKFGAPSDWDCFAEAFEWMRDAKKA